MLCQALLNCHGPGQLQALKLLAFVALGVYPCPKVLQTTTLGQASKIASSWLVSSTPSGTGLGRLSKGGAAATSRLGAGPEAVQGMSRAWGCTSVWIFWFSVIPAPGLFLYSSFWLALPGALSPHLLSSFLSLYKPATLPMDVPEQGMLSISVTIYKKPLSLLFI